MTIKMFEIYVIISCLIGMLISNQSVLKKRRK